ncbi:MAG: serine/threonine protein kinase [Betaproteobacteria bacterium]|nr:serine/threonine protein kinase [Betaproteobacteria bacterium]
MTAVAGSTMETRAIGRYVIESVLGSGAMGVVYKATDPLLERSLAIKTVNLMPSGEGSEYYEKRFYQEARAAAGLNHPNIVTVYDVGRSADAAYMAMELIEGVELRALLAMGQPLSPDRAVAIAVQIAEGLAYAHQRGVVHRDIKPANIMVVGNGLVKITDFGLARRRASADLTPGGEISGSPRYMSPEQALGKRADPRSDIFSLGVLFYEMLTGSAPFGGEDEMALTYQIVNLAPPAPSAVIAAVPRRLDQIAARMLAKSLEERYQNAQEVALDLRQWERRPADAADRPVPVAALSAGARPAIIDFTTPGALAISREHTRRSDGS